MKFDLNRIKAVVSDLPYPVGKAVSLIPFSLRPPIGRLYRKRSHEIELFKRLSVEEKKVFIFERTKDIAVYAYENTKFYNEFYSLNSFDPHALRRYEDILDIPVVSKADLQKVSLEERSVSVKGRSLTNTGGSSGQPLGFYIENSSVAHEWAHIHDAWEPVGFKSCDLKIMFVGRSTVKNVVDYDAGRHSLVVDIYKDFKTIAEALRFSFSKFHPKFIHGYPSAIFDFMLWVSGNDLCLFDLFRKNIKGIILSSEYPSVQVRARVEEIYGIKTLSFYGHTERCVLASELEKPFFYNVYQTYGHADVVKHSGGYVLVGTSYYNRASPLVRYSTGDLVNPIMEHGLLSGFEVAEGRNGDFVYAEDGSKVYLTALVFGRHHKVFEFVSHIQVYQNEKNGIVCFLLTVPRDDVDVSSFYKLMDLSNVNFKYEILVGREPVRTVSGKVPLLVKNLDGYLFVRV